MNKSIRNALAALATAALPVVSMAADSLAEIPHTASTVTTQDGVEPVSYTHLTLPTTPYV